MVNRHKKEAVMNAKIISGILILLSVCLFEEVFAAGIITDRTGAVRITRPDGSTLFVRKDEQLPDMPPSSVIELLDGSMDVAPLKGSIKVVAKDSFFTVNAGERVTVFIPQDINVMGLSVIEGEINAVAMNTLVSVKKSQRVRIKFDKKRQLVEVKSVEGKIETVTLGVGVSIPAGSLAVIYADATARMIHIESAGGVLEVKSIDGKSSRIARGQKIDTPGFETGEITTIKGSKPAGEGSQKPPAPLAEEPAEPERREGSKFTP